MGVAFSVGRHASNSFVLALTVVSLLVPRPALNAQTTASGSLPKLNNRSDEIQHYIDLLGAPDPIVRENARRTLAALGPMAIDQLEKAAQLKSTLDHEVQLQAVSLLEKIREDQTTKLAQQFIDGESTLPGWPEFEAICGDSRVSRKLYRDLYIDFSTQIEKVIRQPEYLNVTEIRYLFNSPSPERVALGLFLLTHVAQETKTSPDAELETGQLGESVRAVINGSALALRGKNESRLPLVKLVCAMYESMPKISPSQKLYLLQLVQHPLIDEKLVDLASPESPTIVRAMALASLSGKKSAKVLASLRSYFDDSTFIGNYLVPANKQTTGDKVKSNAKDQSRVAGVQIRDLCLLASLRIEQKKHSDFGFLKEAVSKGRPAIDIKLSGFVDAEARKKAFDRWQATRSTTPNESR